MFLHHCAFSSSEMQPFSTPEGPDGIFGPDGPQLLLHDCAIEVLSSLNLWGRSVVSSNISRVYVKVAPSLTLEFKKNFLTLFRCLLHLSCIHLMTALALERLDGQITPRALPGHSAPVSHYNPDD
jgi:hypothetical protein